MANPAILTNAAVYVGGYALQSALDQIQLKASKAEPRHNVLGDTIEGFYPGLQQIECSLSGWFDPTVVDGVVWPRIDPSGTVAGWPITICPPGAPAAAPGADGNAAYIVEAEQFNYRIGGAHGDLLRVDIGSRPFSGVGFARGTVLLPSATMSATTTGTGRQLGAVTATQRIVVALHVFAVTGGGTWTATVESDDNGSFTSATTRLTFAGATGITTEIKSLAGAVADDYWRVVLTKSGGTSCVAAAIAAIVSL